MSNDELSFTEPSSKPHCIVVGGGFAGTSAAIRLTEAGWRVTLIEARERPGGRVQSLMDSTTGEIIDNGQHLMMGCYEDTLQLLTRLNTTHILRRQKALRVWFAEASSSNPSNTPFCLDASLLPGKFGVALGMMRLKGLSWQEKLHLLRFATRLQFNFIKPSGKTSAELLREERQSERVIQRLWEPIIVATLNTSVRESSATLFVEVMRLAFLGGGEASQMLIAQTGLDAVLETVPQWLEERGSTFMTATVQSLFVEDEKVCGVRLKTGMTLQSDTVISAVPLQTLTKLLPEEFHDTAQIPSTSLLPTSPIISVYLWFDREFIEQDFVALLGTTVQWVFNRRKLCQSEASVVERFPCHLSLTVSAADRWTSASAHDIIRHCVEELVAVFPSAKTATLLHARVMREKNATPLLTPNNEHLRPNAQTLLSGLFLAGDWTNTGLPATIESASRSGVLAAHAVLDSCNTLKC